MCVCCRDLQSGKVVAVKFIPRPLTKAAIPFMMAEVEIQAELGEGSLNLVSMHEIILTRTHLALVLEYASGGNSMHDNKCTLSFDSGIDIYKESMYVINDIAFLKDKIYN